MKTPIAYGLGWPHRIDAGVEPLDFMRLKGLSFEEADHQRFPCLALAYQAMEMGGVMPAVLNAANEIAVTAFLDEKLKFLDISHVVEETLARFKAHPASSLETVLNADYEARKIAQEAMKDVLP
jgi:1-deoxy-D-xylulose-5-phosphate reductoisomerase